MTAWNFITNPVTEDIVLYAKWIEGAAPGIFTVADPDGIPDSGDESKIVFSRGNLWYDSNGSVWSFETNQYDFRTYPGSASMLYGTYNVNEGTPAGNYGLFGWGTSGYDHGAVCYRPTDISPTSSDYYAYGAVDDTFAYRLQLTNYQIVQAIYGRRHIGQSVRLVIEYH